MDVENYYLNIDGINKLGSKRERDRIHEYYREMLFSISEGRKSMGQAYFNTLLNNGFLIDIRDEKIDKVLNENDGINPGVPGKV